MITSDFYGNQFTWWSGIVEDRNDPLKLGRVRVRIFGMHSDNTARIPKEKLPWAQIMVPTTGTQSFVGPRPGDWVMGFFQDGTNGQLPVVMGTYLGVDSNTSISYALTENNLVGCPRPLGSEPVRQAGQPVVPRTVREVVWGTGVQRTNQDRKHVCDVTVISNANISRIRTAFGTVVEAIKRALSWLANKLGLIPDGGLVRRLINIMEGILSLVRKIKKFLQEIIDIKNVFLALVTKIRNMIAYIMSLPARLVKFLRECLTKFLEALSKQLKSLFAPSGFGNGNLNNPFKELKDTFNELKSEIANVVNQIVDIKTTKDQLLDILTNPPTDAEIADGEQTLNSLLGSSSDPNTKGVFDSLKESVGTIQVVNNQLSVTPGLAAVKLAAETDAFVKKLSANDPVKISNIQTTPNETVTTSAQGRNVGTKTSGPSSLPSSTFLQDIVDVQSSPMGFGQKGESVDLSKISQLGKDVAEMAVSAFPSIQESRRESFEGVMNRPATP